MNKQPKDASGEKPLQVRRGRVDSVDLYEIKDTELDQLEGGSPVNVYLNFSIFTISIAISALVALCTASFDSNLVQTFFVVGTIFGFGIGVLLLILWYQGRKSVSEVIKRIRRRIPPEEHSEIGDDCLPASAGEEGQQPHQPKG